MLGCESLDAIILEPMDSINRGDFVVGPPSFSVRLVNHCITGCTQIIQAEETEDGKKKLLT